MVVLLYVRASACIRVHAPEPYERRNVDVIIKAASEVAHGTNGVPNLGLAVMGNLCLRMSSFGRELGYRQREQQVGASVAPGKGTRSL